jgi:hypothetical protein
MIIFYIFLVSKEEVKLKTNTYALYILRTQNLISRILSFSIKREF